ncbi:hypothetical protein NMY22_g11656 [Coprinellus aureogranulatus]|nr:hypothetical protein NMY22_g11656 [Coprinellus aureogranulatus]
MGRKSKGLIMYTSQQGTPTRTPSSRDISYARVSLPLPFKLVPSPLIRDRLYTRHHHHHQRTRNRRGKHLWPIPLSSDSDSDLGRLPYPPQTLPFLALPSRVSPLPLVHAQARAALGLFASSSSSSPSSPLSSSSSSSSSSSPSSSSSSSESKSPFSNINSALSQGSSKPVLDLKAEREKIRERYEELGGYEKWHVFREGREQFDYREEMYHDFLPPPPPPPSPPLPHLPPSSASTSLSSQPSSTKNTPSMSASTSSTTTTRGEEAHDDREESEDPYAYERTVPPAHRTLYELKGPLRSTWRLLERLSLSSSFVRGVGMKGWLKPDEEGGGREGYASVEDAREAERAWVEVCWRVLEWGEKGEGE